ncbi:MAG: response regulator [Armatimonadetes bacterium]|nr:response regulator [Armatimonadota bacterium]
MIVDDDADIRRLLAVVLRTAGRVVFTAANGQEALTLLHGDNPRPCIILLDLMMPVMDGLQFRQEQLDDPSVSDIPVVLFSALNEVVERARELNAAGYVKKPFDPDKVVEMLDCRCQTLGLHC